MKGQLFALCCDRHWLTAWRSFLCLKRERQLFVVSVLLCNKCCIPALLYVRIGITINATQCRQSVQHECMLGLMVERLMFCVKKSQIVLSSQCECDYNWSTTWIRWCLKYIWSMAEGNMQPFLSLSFNDDVIC